MIEISAAAAEALDIPGNCFYLDDMQYIAYRTFQISRQKGRMSMHTNEELIAFCQEAVRIPSYSGQEKGVAEFMKRKMEEYGFDEVIIDKYGSVLGTINGKRPGKTILMDGHIDTVDVIDAPQWTHDPFGGENDGSECSMRMQ